MNAQGAFEVITQGLIKQSQKSKSFIVDEDGHQDPFGLILGDVNYNETIEGMTFHEINESFLDSKLDDKTCHVIELCQQIHDMLDPEEWMYQLKKTAESEGLDFLIDSEYEREVPTGWSDLF